MKSIKTFIILIVFIVGSVFTLSAQSRTVSGKVFDEQKEPLVGVTVRTSKTELSLPTMVHSVCRYPTKTLFWNSRTLATKHRM
jgi:hypothetical protein